MRTASGMASEGAKLGGCVQGLAWVWEALMLAVAGAVRPPRQLPPVLFYNELAAVPGDAWLGFQAALVAQDRRGAALRKDQHAVCWPPRDSRRGVEAEAATR